MSFAKKRVYLGGPITGLMYQDVRNGWRKEFAKIMGSLNGHQNEDHIELYSPMREKDFVDNNKRISGVADYASIHGFGTPNGILTRDHNDVKECDLMIACFLGAEHVSIGTCVEFGWASAYRKPIIMIMEERATEIIPEKVEHETVDLARLMLTVGPNQTEILERLKQPNAEWKGNKIIGVTRGNEMVDIKYLVPAGKRTIRNLHDHLFLTHTAGYVVGSLKDAADITRSILTPGL